MNRLFNFKSIFSAKILYLIFLFFISACSGGGNSNESEVNESEVIVEPVGTQTGYLGAAAISGVQYKTENHAGVTGSDGSFEYTAGESISFNIGATSLGTIPAKRKINLFDLAETPIVAGVEKATIAVNELYFQGAVNMAVMLQTFDQDGHALSGIQITPEIISLFHDVSINFYVRPDEFRSSFNFRKILNSANDEGLFNVKRLVTTPWEAMDKLYGSLKTDPLFYVEASYKSEGGGVGQSKTNYRSSFDINGYESRREVDNDGDGYSDQIVTSEYNNNGYRIQKNDDQNGDSVLDSIEYITFDVNGEVVGVQIDSDADSIIDQRARYAVNEYGRVTKTEYDSNGDGVFYNGAIITYDSSGNEVYLGVDYDGDGELDRITRSAYDNQGNLTFHEKDQDGDGSPEYISNYSYDSNGNLHLSTIDFDGDGSPDQSYRYVYDDQGHLLLREYDADGDGKLDSIESYIYDGKGNLSRETNDYNGDGNLESISNYTYSEYANGHTVRREHDSDGNGVTDRISVTSYDLNNNIILTASYRASDQKLEQSARYSYDINGYETSMSIDNNGDGYFEIEYHKVYRSDGSVSAAQSINRDQNGQLVSYSSRTLDKYGNDITHEIDHNGDGRANSILSSALNSSGSVIGQVFKSDDEGDGQVDFIYHTSFDNQGNATKYEEDLDGNKIIDRRYIYSYDQNNNRTYLAYDGDADGHFEHIDQYTFDNHGNQTSYVSTDGYGTENVSIKQTYQKVGWHWIFKGQHYR